MLARQFRAERRHALGVIDGDHLPGALRHQLRERSLARAEVRDYQRRHKFQERFRDAFPRSPGHVLPAELARQLVEVAAHVVLPLAQRERKGSLVLFGLGNLAGRLAQKIHQRGRRGQSVEGVLACAAVARQARRLQLRQMRGNLALPLAENLLQLGHGEFFPLQ